MIDSLIQKIRSEVKDLQIWVVQQDCSALEHWGVPGGDPPPIPHGRRGFELNFLILAFFKADSFSYNIIPVAG